MICLSQPHVLLMSPGSGPVVAPDQSTVPRPAPTSALYDHHLVPSCPKSSSIPPALVPLTLSLSQLRCCGWNSPQDWYRVPSLSSNQSEVYHVPCSCLNSSATNGSAFVDIISPPQFSRVGPPARPRHSADLCMVPANSYTYREVGRGRTAGRGVVPRKAGPQHVGGICEVGGATR